MPVAVPNPNTRYAELFVRGLYDAGLRHVCIAPGSRSTPLTLAFAAHEGIEKYLHLDERSAAYFALGVAMATNQTVALVCTSGTATANFLPAIVEAKMSAIPLLILTGDRPHELRHSGANQTIDQVKLYGDQVLWSVDMPIPESHVPENVLRYVQTMAARSYATANGSLEYRREGPVHINFPFRKPLEPTDHFDDVLANRPATVVIESGLMMPSRSSIEQLTNILGNVSQGLIVCGPSRFDTAIWKQLSQLSHKLQFPILADVLSGIRYQLPNTIGGFETFLSDPQIVAQLDDVDVVLFIGGVPTSKWLNQYLEQIKPAYRIQFSHNGIWADDKHAMTHVIHADVLLLLSALNDELPQQNSVGYEWYARWQSLEKRFWNVLRETMAQTFFDGAVIAHVLKSLPDEALIFIGNSNPIRHVEQFVPPFSDVHSKRLRLYANRGASGIDGEISTALGLAAANHEHVYIIVGDLTFYHDMNGLLALKQAGISATIVVINNDGGGIFERLPISQFDPHYTTYFKTPHGLTFESVAQLYHLTYTHVTDWNTLETALHISSQSNESTLIEVQTDIAQGETTRKAIVKAVNQQIASTI